MNTKLYQISTDYILDLLESSISDLEQSTIRGFPNTKRRQHLRDTVSIPEIKLTPTDNMSALEVKSVANNKSNGKKYNCVILFQDVKFEDEGSSSNVSFTASDGEEYHMLPIKSTFVDVSVSCGCMDFLYRFTSANFRDGSLYGEKPQEYIRRTADREPVNPQNVPGLCKHLLSTVDNVARSGILKD